MTLASDIDFALICNVDISQHQFSIDSDKMGNNVP